MAKLHFLLLVFHQLSQRKCCAASYMMILEYHEKYGRRCNFSRRDRELYYLLSPGETRSRFSFYHSHVSRRDLDYILLFSCFVTRTSEGRARKISVNSHEILREREFSLISALKLWHYILCFILFFTFVLLQKSLHLCCSLGCRLASRGTQLTPINLIFCQRRESNLQMNHSEKHKSCTHTF